MIETTHNVQQEHDKEVLEILSWTPEARKTALTEALAMTASGITRAAKIIGAMEEAGDDLSEIPTVILESLRRVRCGQMLPEVFLSFSGILRQRIASLSLTDQRHFIRGGKVRLLVLKDGKAEVLEEEPTALQPAQVLQVFARSRIRSDAEQRTWIEDQALKKSQKAGSVVPASGVHVDKKRGKLIIRGSAEITKRELLNYLTQLE